MKVEICNLGPIKTAEINVKPLTVFIGQNGEGKSWTAYTISAILGGYGLEEYVKAYIEGKTQQKYPPLDDAIKQLLEEGNAKIDLVQFARDWAETYLNDVGRFAPKLMRSFMKSDRLSFKDLQIIVNLAESKTELIEEIEAAFIDKQISFGSQRKPAFLNALKEFKEVSLFFYSSGEVIEKLPPRAVKEFTCQEVFKAIHKALFANPYFFPSERTTFISFSLDKIREINSSIPLIEPVKQLLRSISTAYQDNLYRREEKVKDNPKIGEYLKLAEFLESEIILGKLIFEKFIEKKLLFQPLEEDIALEMPVVSSMVKELAPLVLYLRYLAEPNDLLIIDEPEMNLHPSVQVEIVEFLGMLVNAGLKVLITTHSPYIVDQLVNMMKAEQHEEKEKIKNLFYLESSEAFISQELVSVYLFEEGTTQNILRENGTIDWDTFNDVFEDGMRLYSQLLTVEN